MHIAVPLTTFNLQTLHQVTIAQETGRWEYSSYSEPRGHSKYLLLPEGTSVIRCR